MGTGPVIDERLAEAVLALRRTHETVLPDRQRVPAFVRRLVEVLFPHQAGGDACGTVDGMRHTLEVMAADLEALVRLQADRLRDEPRAVVARVFGALPDIYRTLWRDAQAILDGDPAAASIDEVIVAYPGFYAILVYRFAHELYRQQVPLLPRLFAEHAHVRTGIDIHPGASIAERFCIDHGTGIVIGETCEIGANVKIYQGVSLGALSVTKDLAGVKRHPTIEHNVVIYANATILGGRTVIGHDSVIGGNVWITESVPPFSLVQHKSDVRVRSAQAGDHALDFVI